MKQIKTATKTYVSFTHMMKYWPCKPEILHFSPPPTKKNKKKQKHPENSLWLTSSSAQHCVEQNALWLQSSSYPPELWKHHRSSSFFFLLLYGDGCLACFREINAPQLLPLYRAHNTRSSQSHTKSFYLHEGDIFSDTLCFEHAVINDLH